MPNYQSMVLINPKKQKKHRTKCKQSKVTEYKIKCCFPGCNGIVHCFRRSPRQLCLECQAKKIEEEKLECKQIDPYDDKRY